MVLSCCTFARIEKPGGATQHCRRLAHRGARLRPSLFTFDRNNPQNEGPKVAPVSARPAVAFLEFLA